MTSPSSSPPSAAASLANATTLQAELLLDCRCVLGECPIWDPRSQLLMWVDIEGRAFHSYDVASGAHEQQAFDKRACCFALTPTEGEVLLALEDEVVLYDVPAKAVRRSLYAIEQDVEGTRMNDGRCDRDGRFVMIGYNMNHKNDGQASAGCYRTDPSVLTASEPPAAGGYQPTRLFEWGVKVGNGLSFTLDGRAMHVTDSPTRTLWQYEYPSGDGLPRNGRKLFEVDPAVLGEGSFVDGTIVDSEGHLWCSIFKGGRILRVNASTGAIDTVVDVPVANPTCICLGGKDLDTLFITTTRRVLTDEELQQMPTSGSIFTVKVPVPGLPECIFGGGPQA